jgi:hypothetical protein
LPAQISEAPVNLSGSMLVKRYRERAMQRNIVAVLRKS